MLEIIFNGIALIGCLTLLVLFYRQALIEEKKRNESYYRNLTDSIIEGVHIGMERWSIAERAYARTLAEIEGKRSNKVNENVKGE